MGEITQWDDWYFIFISFTSEYLFYEREKAVQCIFMLNLIMNFSLIEISMWIEYTCFAIL